MKLLYYETFEPYGNSYRAPYNWPAFLAASCLRKYCIHVSSL